jgi:hypothetical protein
MHLLFGVATISDRKLDETMPSFERVTMFRSNGIKMCKIECSRFVHSDETKLDRYTKFVEYSYTVKRERTNRRTRATQKFPMVVVEGWGHAEPESFMNDAGTENRYEVGSDDAENAFFAQLKSGMKVLFDTRNI